MSQTRIRCTLILGTLTLLVLLSGCCIGIDSSRFRAGWFDDEPAVVDPVTGSVYKVERTRGITIRWAK